MVLIHHHQWLFIVLIIFTAGLVTPARADSAAAARIGEIWVQDEAGAARYHHGFADGLRELGYVEGQNLIVLTRYPNGDESRLVVLEQTRCSRLNASGNSRNGAPLRRAPGLRCRTLSLCATLKALGEGTPPAQLQGVAS